MARIKTQKKSARGQDIKCGRCHADINPGDEYRKVGLKTGPRSSVTKYRCMKPACGFRSSELTTSRMSAVYELNERLDDACSTLRAKGDTLTLKDVEEFKSEVESIRDDAQTQAEEFQEAFDNMPEQFQSAENGEKTQARQEACDEFYNELDSLIDNVEWPEEDDVEEPADECETCTMAQLDPRHTPGGDQFEHEFKAPEPVIDPDKRGGVTFADEFLGSFEGLSIDCD